MGYKIAIVGATGNVGHEILDILDERGFPADEVIALASRRSQGTEVSFGDKTLKVKALEGFDFAGVDIALMSAGAIPLLGGEGRQSAALSAGAAGLRPVAARSAASPSCRQSNRADGSR